MSIWDDPNLIENNDYIKFDTEGTSVTGTILAMSIHEFEGGTRAPKLILETEQGEKTLTAGQVQLKKLLAEKKPDIGDTITITYVRSEKRMGGKTLKHFTVEVNQPATTKAPKPAQQSAVLNDSVIAALAKENPLAAEALAKLGVTGL